MNDLGGRLRQAREGKGISLRQIAASTKISVAVLEALERNDVSKRPGGVFSRALVRSYATEIGLDPDRTLEEFRERFDADTVVEQPGSWASREEIAFEARKKLAARVFLLVLFAMLLAAALLAYYLLRTRPL